MVRDYSPEELSYLATSFAVAITKDLDNASIKVMCNFFVQVVGTLNLILTQRNLLKEKKKHHEGRRDCCEYPEDKKASQEKQEKPPGTKPAPGDSAGRNQDASPPVR
jgi:hypothetical protein